MQGYVTTTTTKVIDLMQLPHLPLQSCMNTMTNISELCKYHDAATGHMKTMYSSAGYANPTTAITELCECHTTMAGLCEHHCRCL